MPLDAANTTRQGPAGSLLAGPPSTQLSHPASHHMFNCWFELAAQQMQGPKLVTDRHRRPPVLVSQQVEAWKPYNPG